MSCFFTPSVAYKKNHRQQPVAGIAQGRGKGGGDTSRHSWIRKEAGDAGASTLPRARQAHGGSDALVALGEKAASPAQRRKVSGTPDRGAGDS
ncbi:hypothetical protein J31TS4_12910 [Paenibacillus sp. J31TS4]|nr:hypothetical protein J31TS4_12910 [Paenibacillus sp. J31TS4]